MPDILRLHHLRALEVHDEGDHYRIEAIGDVVPTACPVCASSLYKHGTQRQSFMDTPMHGKRVLLDIERRRYRCKNCGKTLFDPLQVVSMDMWSVYRQVAHAEFPGRLIVADRFHVVRMATDAMERARKAVRKTLAENIRLKLKDDRNVLLVRGGKLNQAGQEKLAEWTTMFPLLGAAYTTKETFHDIYAHADKQTAMDAARSWLSSIPPQVEPYFRETKDALQSWWDEIFNYYDASITNGYTDSANRLAQDMNRMGRGYSFDVIRAPVAVRRRSTSWWTQECSCGRVQEERKCRDATKQHARLRWVHGKGNANDCRANFGVRSLHPHPEPQARRRVVRVGQLPQTFNMTALLLPPTAN